jgi:hypothetical protein
MLTLRSALPVPATVVVAGISVLLILVGSVVAEVAETLSVITVPAAVPAFTCTTTVKVVEEPLASVEVFVQVRVRGLPDGAGQVQPVVVPEIVTVWKVVFVGITSVKVTGLAALWGPLLVNTWVYVMGSPAAIVVTEGVLVIERSASPVIKTFVIVISLLLAGIGSVVTDEVAEAVLLTGVLVPEVITSGKLAVPPEIRVAIVQVTVPVPPTVGFEQLQPPGVVIDENVVPVGMVSVNVIFAASLGPLLVKICAYVIVAPEVTEAGPDAAIDRSACATTVSVIVTELLAIFGSILGVRATDPVSVRIAPFAVPEGSFTTTVKGPADAPVAKLPLERLHEIVPVPPTAGCVGQAHPAGGVTDT